MLYLLWGILTGIIISLIPIWIPSGAVEINPQWETNLKSINNIRNPIYSPSNTRLYPIKTPADLYIIDINGKPKFHLNIDKKLIAISKSGNYYIKYDKAGDHIELTNAMGQRFWKIKSKEYPYLSYNAKIILLLNGDHSRVRIVDINGSEVGARQISGRLCTAISFSKYSDYSGVGFLDGSYYFFNEKGNIINEGTAPDNTIIKGLKISSNGKYCIIHYGNNNKDSLLWIAEEKKISKIINLKYVHKTRTALHVSDKGDVAAIDFTRILLTQPDEDQKTIITIPQKRPGASTIDLSKNLYSSGYTDINGKSRFFIFNKTGTIIFHKQFSNQSFLKAFAEKNSILLRGSENLFCYSFDLPVN